MDEHSTRTMPRWLQAALIAAVAAAVALPAGAFAAQTLGERFDDVDAADTHAEAIGWLADAGVTAGCTPDEYCPTDGVTRAQMATFMQRLAGGDGSVDPVVDAASVGGIPAEDLATSSGLNVTPVAGANWGIDDDEEFFVDVSPERVTFRNTGNAEDETVSAHPNVPVSSLGEPQYLHRATICYHQGETRGTANQVGLAVFSQDFVDPGFTPDTELEVVNDDLDAVVGSGCETLTVDLDPDEADTTQGYPLTSMEHVALTAEFGDGTCCGHQFSITHAEVVTSSDEFLAVFDPGLLDPGIIIDPPTFPTGE